MKKDKSDILKKAVKFPLKIVKTVGEMEKSIFTVLVNPTYIEKVAAKVDNSAYKTQTKVEGGNLRIELKEPNPDIIANLTGWIKEVEFNMVETDRIKEQSKAAADMLDKAENLKIRFSLSSFDPYDLIQLKTIYGKQPDGSFFDDTLKVIGFKSGADFREFTFETNGMNHAQVGVLVSDKLHVIKAKKRESQDALTIINAAEGLSAMYGIAIEKGHTLMAWSKEFDYGELPGSTLKKEGFAQKILLDSEEKTFIGKGVFGKVAMWLLSFFGSFSVTDWQYMGKRLSDNQYYPAYRKGFYFFINHGTPLTGNETERIDFFHEQLRLRYNFGELIHWGGGLQLMQNYCDRLKFEYDAEMGHLESDGKTDSE